MAARVGIEREIVYFVLAILVATACVIKIASLSDFPRDPWWRAYGVIVTAYIFSRFGLAWFYRPRPPVLAEAQLPAVALIVPAYNEEREIGATVRSCLNVDYPPDLLRVVVVDDCSRDATLSRLRDLQKDHAELVVIPLAANGGKRQAMAAGIAEAGDAEVLVFIDSDSRLDPAAVRTMVRYFADRSVGAVSGHTDVSNRDTNLLTRMQAVRYFVAFRVYKAAEALFGAVTCCSGCFSAYRRSAIDPILPGWTNQTFLGEPSTFGDDRSLTNSLLPSWSVVYAPDARAHTTVPDALPQFLRQQLRWKKSWARESLRASGFMWRKNPVMAVSFYLGFGLPLVAPLVVSRAIVLATRLDDPAPLWYMGGVIVMAAVYGLFYRLHRRDRIWYYGILFAVFYAGVLVWQMPYALVTIRNSKWGTR